MQARSPRAAKFQALILPSFKAPHMAAQPQTPEMKVFHKAAKGLKGRLTLFGFTVTDAPLLYQLQL